VPDFLVECCLTTPTWFFGLLLEGKKPATKDYFKTSKKIENFRQDKKEKKISSGSMKITFASCTIIRGNFTNLMAQSANAPVVFGATRRRSVSPTKLRSTSTLYALRYMPISSVLT
jgi:hypothetical protein